MQFKPVIRVAIYFLAAATLAGSALLNWTQRRMIVRLSEQNQAQLGKLNELGSSRSESLGAPLFQNDQVELDRLRKNTSELLRLRHESAVHREQLKELSTLRAANAQLLQALQRAPDSPTNQHASLHVRV